MTQTNTKYRIQNAVNVTNTARCQICQSKKMSSTSDWNY